MARKKQVAAPLPAPISYTEDDNNNFFANHYDEQALGDAQRASFMPSANEAGADAYQQTMEGAQADGLVPGGDTVNNGFFGTMKDAADAGFFSSLAGTARFGAEFSPFGGDALNSAADYLDQKAAFNTPTEQPTGANYVAGAIGNAIGSGAAAMAQAAVVAGIGKALGLTAVGGAAAGVISKVPGYSRLAALAEGMWKTPFGKIALGEVAGSPFEAMAEGGNLITEMRNEGYTDDEIRQAALTSAGYNMAWLTVANMLEAGVEAKIAKGMAKQGAKGAVNKTIMDTVDKTWGTALKRGAVGAGFGAVSEGGEEFGQNLIGNIAKGEDLNYDDATEAAIQGAIGGGFLKGAGTVGHVKLGDNRKDFISDGHRFEASDYYDLNGAKLRDYTIDGQEVTDKQFMDAAGIEDSENVEENKYGFSRKDYAAAVLERELDAIGDNPDEAKAKASLTRILDSDDTEKIWQAAKKVDGKYSKQSLFESLKGQKEQVATPQDGLVVEGEPVDEQEVLALGPGRTATTPRLGTTVTPEGLRLNPYKPGSQNTNRPNDTIVMGGEGKRNANELGTSRITDESRMLPGYTPGEHNTHNGETIVPGQKQYNPMHVKGITDKRMVADGYAPFLRRMLGNILFGAKVNNMSLAEDDKKVIRAAIQNKDYAGMMDAVNMLNKKYHLQLPNHVEGLHMALMQVKAGNENARAALVNMGVPGDLIDTYVANVEAEPAIGGPTVTDNGVTVEAGPVTDNAGGEAPAAAPATPAAKPAKDYSYVNLDSNLKTKEEGQALLDNVIAHIRQNGRGRIPYKKRFEAAIDNLVGKKNGPTKEWGRRIKEAFYAAYTDAVAEYEAKKNAKKDGGVTAAPAENVTSENKTGGEGTTTNVKKPSEKQMAIAKKLAGLAEKFGVNILTGTDASVEFLKKQIDSGKLKAYKDVVVNADGDIELIDNDGNHVAVGGAALTIDGNGHIVLGDNDISVDSTVHEYTHVWNKLMQQKNPELWAKIVKALKATQMWKDIAADKDYQKLHKGDENRIADEVMAQLSGKNANKLFRDMKDAGDSDAVIGKVRAALKAYWNKVADFIRQEFGLAKETTVDDIVNMPLIDLLQGEELAEAVKGHIDKKFENLWLSTHKKNYTVAVDTAKRELTQKAIEGSQRVIDALIANIPERLGPNRDIIVTQEAKDELKAVYEQCTKELNELLASIQNPANTEKQDELASAKTTEDVLIQLQADGEEIISSYADGKISFAVAEASIDELVDNPRYMNRAEEITGDDEEALSDFNDEYYNCSADLNSLLDQARQIKEYNKRNKPEGKDEPAPKAISLEEAENISDVLAIAEIQADEIINDYKNGNMTLDEAADMIDQIQGPIGEPSQLEARAEEIVKDEDELSKFSRMLEHLISNKISILENTERVEQEEEEGVDSITDRAANPPKRSRGQKVGDATVVKAIENAYDLEEILSYGNERYIIGAYPQGYDVNGDKVIYKTLEEAEAKVQELIDAKKKASEKKQSEIMERFKKFLNTLAEEVRSEKDVEEIKKRTYQKWYKNGGDKEFVNGVDFKRLAEAAKAALKVAQKNLKALTDGVPGGITGFKTELGAAIFRQASKDGKEISYKDGANDWSIKYKPSRKSAPYEVLFVENRDSGVPTGYTRSEKFKTLDEAQNFIARETSPLSEDDLIKAKAEMSSDNTINEMAKNMSSKAKREADEWVGQYKDGKITVENLKEHLDKVKKDLERRLKGLKRSDGIIKEAIAQIDEYIKDELDLDEDKLYKNLKKIVDGTATGEKPGEVNQSKEEKQLLQDAETVLRTAIKHTEKKDYTVDDAENAISQIGAMATGINNILDTNKLGNKKISITDATKERIRALLKEAREKVEVIRPTSEKVEEYKRQLLEKAYKQARKDILESVKESSRDVYGAPWGSVRSAIYNLVKEALPIKYRTGENAIKIDDGRIDEIYKEVEDKYYKYDVGVTYDSLTKAKTLDDVRDAFRDKCESIIKDYEDGKLSYKDANDKIEYLQGSIDGKIPDMYMDRAEKITDNEDELSLLDDRLGIDTNYYQKKLGKLEDKKRGNTIDLKIKTAADVRKAYEGTGKWLKAPNGKPTNLSEEQWVNVRTENFKNWFGDWEKGSRNVSKVVDENGEPLVVYHGSPNEFTEFRRSTMGTVGQGMYFAFDRSVATGFARGGKVYECFLNIKKPVKLKNIDSADKGFWEKFGGVDDEDTLKNVKEAGYDGVIIREDKMTIWGSGARQLAVFDANQIKSAANNNGDYSVTNNNIELNAGTLFDKKSEDYAVSMTYKDMVQSGEITEARQMVKNAIEYVRKLVNNMWGIATDIVSEENGKKVVQPIVPVINENGNISLIIPQSDTAAQKLDVEVKRDKNGKVKETYFVIEDENGKRTRFNPSKNSLVMRHPFFREWNKNADFKLETAFKDIQQALMDGSIDETGRVIREDGKIVPFTSVVKKNGEYEVNFDFGTTCPKREGIRAFMDRLIDEGFVQQLNETKIAGLTDVLRSKGIMTPCTFCFVETKRTKALNSYNTFSYEWNSVLRGLFGDDKIGDLKSREAADKAIGETSLLDTTSPVQLTQAQYERLVAMAGKDENGKMIKMADGSYGYSDAYKRFIYNEDRRDGKNDSGMTANKMQKIADMLLKDVIVSQDKNGKPVYHSFLCKRFKADYLLNSQNSSRLIHNFNHIQIENLFAGMYGSATPKVLQGYLYYDGLGMASLDGKLYDFKKNDGMVGQSKANFLNHIYDIGGSRHQSFTDSNPILAIDKMQFILDLWLRQLPCHEYTKVPSDVQIFGETGMNINMSLISSIHSYNEKWNAGFKHAEQDEIDLWNSATPEERRNSYKKVDGKLVHIPRVVQFKPNPKYKRVMKNGVDANEKSKYIPFVDYDNPAPKTGTWTYSWDQESFPPKEAFLYRRGVQYRADGSVRNYNFGGRVGTIVVCMSDNQLDVLMDDPSIDYIIPYHTSSISPEMKAKYNLDKSSDFTNTQNTSKKKASDAEAKEVAFDSEKDDEEKAIFGDKGFNHYVKRGVWVDKNGNPVVIKNYNLGTEKAPKVQNVIATGVINPKNAKGLTLTHDARACARAYVAWCRENGYHPKFERYAERENYYKVLEDFRMYDDDGNPVMQRPVAPVFHKDIMQILDSALTWKESNMTAIKNETDKGSKEFLGDKGVQNQFKYQRIDTFAKKFLLDNLNKVLGKGNTEVLIEGDFYNKLAELYGDEAKAKIEVLRKNNDVVYGFKQGNKIYLNADLFNANTPVHEFTHVFVDVVKAYNPGMWSAMKRAILSDARGVEVLKNIRKEALGDSMYSGLNNGITDENTFSDSEFSEALSRLTGEAHERYIQGVIDADKKFLKTPTKIGERLKQVIAKFFTAIKKVIKSLGDVRRFNDSNVSEMSFEEAINMPIRALYDDTAGQKAFREAVAKLNKKGVKDDGHVTSSEASDKGTVFEGIELNASANQTFEEKARGASSTHFDENIIEKARDIKREPVSFIKKQARKLYKDWIDKNYDFAEIDAIREKNLGRDLKDQERIYDKVQGIPANAEGDTYSLLYGTGEHMKVTNGRLRNVKMKHPEITMRTVLEGLKEGNLSQASKDFMKRFGFKDAAEALGAVLTWRRSRELYRVFEAEHDQWEQDKAQHSMAVEMYKEYKSYLKEKQEWENKIAGLKKFGMSRPINVKYKGKHYTNARELMAELEKDKPAPMKNPGKPEPFTKQEPVMPKIANGMTEEELEKAIKLASPQFIDACEDYYKLNDNILCLLEDAGVISNELHELLNNKYKEYCPLQRDFSETAPEEFEKYLTGFQVGGTGAANVSNMIQRISKAGSETVVINPLETTTKVIQMAARRAERNKACQAFVNLSTEPGMSDICHIVNPVGYNPDGTPKYPAARPEKSTFTVMENGKKITYWCEPIYYDAVVGYNEPSGGVVWNFMSMFAKALRIGATSSPSFIIRNGVRDTLQAACLTDVGMKPFLGTWDGLMEIKKGSELVTKFEAMGITSFTRFKDGKEIYKSLNDMVKDERIDWSSPLAFCKSSLSLGLDKYQGFNEAVEMATRLEIFKLSLQKTEADVKAGKLTEAEALEIAARKAKVGTTDFSRSGVKGQKWNQVIPFFNATIQGGDMLARLLANPKTRNRTLFQIGKYIVLPSIGIWAMNADKDWWKELNPEIKYSNWCIDENFRIPIPQEAGVIFGGGMMAFMDAAMKNDPKAVGTWANTARANMIPNYIPTVFLPIVEWQTNYSFFTGKPVVSQRLQRLPDEMQYTNGTSDLSRIAGKATGQSPVKIDNTVRNYTGTMGMFLWRGLGLPFSDEAGGTEKKTTELPFIRDFVVTDSIRSRYMNDFYEMQAAAQQQHNAYGRKGYPSEAVRSINAAQRVISDYQKQIREIEKTERNKALARRKVDVLRQKANAVAKKAVDKYGSRFS